MVQHANTILHTDLYLGAQLMALLVLQLWVAVVKFVLELSNNTMQCLLLHQQLRLQEITIYWRRHAADCDVNVAAPLSTMA